MDESKLLEVIANDDAEHIADKLSLRYVSDEQDGSDGQDVCGIIADFVSSYKLKKEKQSDEKWLVRKFRENSRLWPSRFSLKADAHEITETIESFYEAGKDLRENPKDRETWLERRLETGAASNGCDAVQYAATVDSAIKNANERLSAEIAGMADERQHSAGTDAGGMVQNGMASANIQNEAIATDMVSGFNWKNFKLCDISRSIGKSAALTAALAVSFQAARILGRRLVNKSKGLENNSLSADLSEFLSRSLHGGAAAGATVAIVGAMAVAAKKGLLGSLLKKSSAGVLAMSVCLGVENARLLYQYSKKEITGEEAMEKAGRNTLSLAGSLVATGSAAKIGAAIGAVFGPVGIILGGMAGGAIGRIAGGTVGSKLFDGGNKIVRHAVNALRSTMAVIKPGAREAEEMAKVAEPGFS